MTPQLLRIDPDHAAPGTSFTLTCIGHQFQAGAVIVIDGKDSLPTVFYDESGLGTTAVIPSNATGALSVLVRNPGGEVSTPLALTMVTGGAVITSATPNFFNAYGSCRITFKGTNFPTGSVPDLQAQLLTTAGQSVLRGVPAQPTSDPTTLIADLMFTGNTPPGSNYVITFVSEALNLHPVGVAFVVRPTPVVKTLAPTSGPGLGPFTLTVTGTDFPLDGARCSLTLWKWVGQTMVRVGGSAAPKTPQSATTFSDAVTLDAGTPNGTYEVYLDVVGYGGATPTKTGFRAGLYTKGSTSGFVTQALVEMLYQISTVPAVSMTQAVVEIIGPGRPTVRVTQAALETITTVTRHVPDLVGLSVTAATAALAAADLVLGDVVEVFHATMPDNDVISQAPVAGTVVGPGTAVAVLVSEGPPPPMFVFKIAGTDKTTWVRANGSFRIESQLGARTQATIEVRDFDSFASAYRPKLDDRLDIIAPPPLFTGVLMTVNDGPLGAPGVGTVTKAQAGDDWRLAAKRRVTKTYAVGTTLQAIATDLVTTYLKPYGIKLDPTMAAGPALTEPFTCDLERIDSTFNRLALLTGWVYRLTPQNVIEWFAIGTKTRGTVFSTANKNILGEINWSQTQSDYVNRVILRYGSGTPARTDSFVGDGHTRSFKLTYPLAVAGWISYPAVVTDQQQKDQRGTTTPGAARPGVGSAQPNHLEYYPSDFPALATYQSLWPNLVYLTPPGGGAHFPAGWGPNQQPPAANGWYWDYERHALVHDQNFPYNPNNPALGKITPASTKVGFGPYLGLKKEAVGVGFHWHYDPATNSIVSDYPFAPPAGIAFTFDYTANYPLTLIVEDAADIAAHEVSEQVFDAPDIFEVTEATAYAKSLLQAGGATPRTVVLSTRLPPGFLPGDTVRLDVPARTLPNSQWLVTAATVVLADDQTMTTTLTLLEGTQIQGSWIDFWRNTLGGSKAGSGITQPGASSVVRQVLLLGEESSEGSLTTTPAIVTMVPPHTPGRLVKWGTETNTITDVLDTDPYGITALTGDVRTGVGGGPQDAVIQPGAVTNPKLRDSRAISVMGRAAITAGPPDDIVAPFSSGYPLREDSGAIGFGPLNGAALMPGSVTNDKLATPGSGGGGTLPLTTKGDLVAHDGAAPVRVPVGAAGQVLAADAAAAPGVSWKTVVQVPDGGPTTVPVPIGQGGTGQSSKQTAFDALSPATTKGDLILYGPTGVRLPVGADGKVLTADAAAATGVSWQAPSNDLASELIVTGSPRSLITLDAGYPAKAHFEKPQSGMSIVGENLSQDATGWVLDNTALPGGALVLMPGSSALSLLVAAAGVNPRPTTFVLTVRSDGAIFERSRSAALGDWINIPFNAANFSASGSMVWTVAAGSIQTLAYTIIGRTVMVFFNLSGTLTGTGSTDLFIQMPFIPTISTVSTVRSGFGTGATPWINTITYFLLANGKLGFQPSVGGNFTPGAGNYYVQGTAFCQL